MQPEAPVRGKEDSGLFRLEPPERVKSPNVPINTDSVGSTSGDIRNARNGDQDAWGRLYRKVGPWLERRLRNMELPPTVESEDVVQLVMLDVFRNLQSFDPAGKLRAWLTVLLERRSRDLWRRYRAQKRGSGSVRALDAIEDAGDRFVDESADAPSAAARQSELADAVTRALKILSPQEREVLRLREEELMAFGDIAKKFGWTEVNARTKCFRARNLVRDEISRLVRDFVEGSDPPPSRDEP